MTASRPMTVLAAPDKFRGSLTAPEVAEAIRVGALAASWECFAQPLADGGEGMVDAFGGPNRTSTVTGPAGTPLEASWRLEEGTAIIESSAASGLAVAGGMEANDPMTATTTGTGQLIAEAVQAGARRVLVGLGGSATTDGGIGAVEAIVDQLQGPIPPEVELLVACDVQTLFVDAATVFGPQKGATPEQIVTLTGRLAEQQAAYAERFGVDLRDQVGGGAAGGLGGGLMAIGGRLVPGFELVAGQVDLAGQLQHVGLVVTGEGALDAESFHGKVVGGVIAAAQATQPPVPVLVLAGQVREDIPDSARTDPLVTLVDLSATFGEEASWNNTAQCVHDAVRAHVAELAGS